MISTSTDTSPQKVKVIIIDDDPASVEVLAMRLKDYEWATVVGTAPTVEEGKVLIDKLLPDIIFLDIEFNGESGLEIAEMLRTRMQSGMKTVFYTSYRKYLIQALRLEAFDFLLKPFDSRELSVIMNRYLIDKERDDKCIEAAQAIPAYSQTSTPLSITTITNDRLILPPSRIVFFKYDSERKIWEVVLDNLKRVILKKQTTSDTIISYGSDFVRTHKAYIVNVRYISMLSGPNCILIPPYDRLEEIKISKTYRHELLARFYDL